MINFLLFFLKNQVNQNNLENAKIIFYRAAQQCPWSKVSLIMMVFTLGQ